MFQRALTRLTLVLAVYGIASAVLIAVTGGLETEVLGVGVSARNPLRALLIGSMALTIYILAGGAIRAPSAALIARLQSGPHARVSWPLALASILSATVAVGIWIYGTKAVGGADSYGYMSQSELWAEGLPMWVRPIIGDVPWPDAAWTFSPVGAYRPMSSFRPVEGTDRWTVVPVYPPGLPLFLTVAGAIGGYQAKYMVVPMFAGVLVLATYGIGRRLISPVAGLIAAWLVATSPPVLFIAVVVMSDVPAAALWAAALFFTLGHGRASAAAAGAAAAAAVLVRPNLAPLAPIIGLRYVPGLFHRQARAAALRDGVLFAALFAAPVCALGLLHNLLYGSPTASGYGSTSGFFAVEHILPNTSRYFSWFVEAQTIWALAGFAALFVPVRQLWPTGGMIRFVVPLFVCFVWSAYIAFLVWEDWWYLRFVLPTYPLIMTGTAALATAIVRWRPRELGWVVGALILALGMAQLNQAHAYGVQNHWASERRYVMAAQMLREHAPRESLVIANQHTATARYYGSRTSIRFDFLDPDWLDRAVRWLARRDVHTYLLVEEWELDDFKRRFVGERTVAALDRPPVAIYRNLGTVYLFDLSRERSPDASVAYVTGVHSDLWAVRPAPDPPPFDFER